MIKIVFLFSHTTHCFYEFKCVLAFSRRLVVSILFLLELLKAVVKLIDEIKAALYMGLVFECLVLFCLKGQIADYVYRHYPIAGLWHSSSSC